MPQKREMALLGKRLKEARVEAGLTQDEVVEGIQAQTPWLACKRSTLANWEAGRNMPGVLHLRALCMVLGVAPYRIFWGANPFAFTQEEATELYRVTRGASSGLQRRVDTLLCALRTAPDVKATVPR